MQECKNLILKSEFLYLESADIIILNHIPVHDFQKKDSLLPSKQKDHIEILRYSTATYIDGILWGGLATVL